MPESEFSPEITQILSQWSAGDAAAATRLIPMVYQELRRLARQYLGRERADHTLQPTALVHEAYLRLAEQKRARWENRAQFFAVAGQLMRRILVDHARAHAAAKRGAQAEHIQLEDALIPVKERSAELLALDDALTQLSALDNRKSRVVELRFFAGLTTDETAEAMGLTSATVRRDWTFAKAWLHKTINRSTKAHA
jgi:RNA polymerase sigma factor (TIGR02999 family)